tara:strand:- start:126 stop:590 length:465 start_codon:yes stop_codon:yes gene_type:complete
MYDIILTDLLIISYGFLIFFNIQIIILIMKMKRIKRKTKKNILTNKLKNNNLIMSKCYFEVPDEIWGIIKDFMLNYKKSHMIRMKPILENEIVSIYGPICERWTHFPPWPNSNDIIQEENYPVPNIPNLPLTSICWNVKGTGGWWCGYGWKKNR